MSRTPNRRGNPQQGHKQQQQSSKDPVQPPGFITDPNRPHDPVSGRSKGKSKDPVPPPGFVTNPHGPTDPGSGRTRGVGHGGPPPPPPGPGKGGGKTPPPTGGKGGNPPPNGGKGTGGGQGGGSGTPQDPNQIHQREDVFAYVDNLLNQWGLGSLAHYVRSWAMAGMGSDEIQLRLQDTPEWHQRFAGNDLRVKQGLSVLSPAQYLAQEDAYKQAMRQYDLPQGFYDSKAESDAWIGADVSPQELNDRLKAASDLVTSQPDALKLFNQWYGGGKTGAGNAVAAILDPSKAESLILQQTASAGIGGAAVSQGLQANQTQDVKLAQHGTTLQQAQQAYAQIAQRLTTDHAVASRFGGTTFNQTDEENATLMDDAKAQQKQNLLYSEEGAQFGGHGAFNAASNAIETNY